MKGFVYCISEHFMLFPSFHFLKKGLLIFREFDISCYGSCFILI